MKEGRKAKKQERKEGQKEGKGGSGYFRWCWRHGEGIAVVVAIVNDVGLRLLR